MEMKAREIYSLDFQGSVEWKKNSREGTEANNKAEVNSQHKERDEVYLKTTK